MNGRRVVASVPKGLSKHACAYASSKADNEAVAECRWAFPTLRLSQQRTDSLRALTTGEKRAYQRATRDYAAGGRLQGHSRQGLQEERVNSNHSTQHQRDTFLARALRTRWEERSVQQAAWRVAREEAVRRSKSRAKTRRTRFARARRAAEGREGKEGVDVLPSDVRQVVLFVHERADHSCT